MRLFRSHGLGNDYLVLEAGTIHPTRVRAICDRSTGVGSDGILEPVPPRKGADFGLRIHNPDGSEAEKSGNGLRIYADWLVRRRGAPRTFTVWTPGGVVRCEVGDEVTVAMGRARFWGPETLAGLEVWRVDVGNPHAVHVGIPTDWQALGAAVEQAPPGRTNVQFIEAIDRGRVRARVWERGAGHTRSSGSSACAVAMVACALGWTDAAVRVEMEGGDLGVTVRGDPHEGAELELVGPVEPVAVIEVDEGWLARR